MVVLAFIWLVCLNWFSRMGTIWQTMDDSSSLCKHLSRVRTAGRGFVASFHTWRTTAVCVCVGSRLGIDLHLQLSPTCVLLMERLLCKEWRQKKPMNTRSRRKAKVYKHIFRRRDRKCMCILTHLSTSKIGTVGLHEQHQARLFAVRAYFVRL